MGLGAKHRKLKPELAPTRPALALLPKAGVPLALPAPTPTRDPVIDCVRGLAVVAMVAFHLSFDLQYFGYTWRGRALAFPSWYWQIVPACIGGTFLFLLGLSAKLRFLRAGKASFSGFRRRALTIGALALGVNLVTFAATPATPIYFGVLHMAAAAFLLLPLFLPFPRLALASGAVFAAAGFALFNARFEFRHLLWLGFTPERGAGWDYYPLLPWLGIVLLGTALGPRLRARARFDFIVEKRRLAPLLWLGRKSLFVYIVHQPILLACLWVAGIARF